MKITETTVAAAAFFLSLCIVGSGVIAALKGPEVDVVPPEQVLFYRSGGVLNLAVRLPVINNASGYNDLVTGARLQIRGVDATFPLTEIAIPVFNDEVGIRAQKSYCQPTLRCQRFSHMAVSQRAETVVTVPAGGAQADYYSFELYCDAKKNPCKGFDSFGDAVTSLTNKPLALTLWLDLHADGRRRITCSTGAIDAAYLTAAGWLASECEDRSAAEV